MKKTDAERIAAALTALADAVRSLAAEAPATTADDMIEVPKVIPAEIGNKEDNDIIPEHEEKKAKAITLEEIRTFMTEKSRKGEKEAIKKALSYVGATKLSDVKEEMYGELWVQIEYWCGDLHKQLEEESKEEKNA